MKIVAVFLKIFLGVGLAAAVSSPYVYVKYLEKQEEHKKKLKETEKIVNQMLIALGVKKPNGSQTSGTPSPDYSIQEWGVG